MRYNVHGMQHKRREYLAILYSSKYYYFKIIMIISCNIFCFSEILYKSRRDIILAQINKSNVFFYELTIYIGITWKFLAIYFATPFSYVFNHLKSYLKSSCVQAQAKVTCIVLMLNQIFLRSKEFDKQVIHICTI